MQVRFEGRAAHIDNLVHGVVGRRHAAFQYPHFMICKLQIAMLPTDASGIVMRSTGHFLRATERSPMPS